MDLVTITDDGSVELLNWAEDLPESMVVIEIGTGADGLGFDDIDDDSDIDIVLEYTGKDRGSEALTYIEGWKFTPEN